MSRKLYWSITDICNLQCRYCYYNAGLEKKHFKYVSKDDFIKVVDDLCANFGEFILTGGEVFSHPESLFFIEELKKRQKTVGILTNATLLTEEKCKQILDLGVDSIAISLDSLDVETNDYLRGQTDKVLRSINAILALKRDKVGLEIMMTVSRKNITSIKPIIEFCIKNKLNLWLDPVEIDHKCSAPDLVALDLKKMTPSESAELYSSLEQWAGNDQILIDYIENCKELFVNKRPTNITCPMGTNSFVLDPDGNLYPCFLRKDLPLGNVLTANTKDLLEKFSTNPQLASLQKATCVRLGCVCMTIASNYQPYV